MDKLKFQNKFLFIKSNHYDTIFGQADIHPGKLKMGLLARMSKLSSNLKLYTVQYQVYNVIRQWDIQQCQKPS